MAIRTIRLTPGENQRHSAILGVGGAIVADSDGMDEWRECLVKGSFARGAAGGFDLIETMRFDPMDGIPLLELHLERMKASASPTGLHLRTDTRRATGSHALCFELEQPARFGCCCRVGASWRSKRAQHRPRGPPNLRAASRLPPASVARDWRLRHKTTDRILRSGIGRAQEHGAAEALCARGPGHRRNLQQPVVERGPLLNSPAALACCPGCCAGSCSTKSRARRS